MHFASRSGCGALLAFALLGLAGCDQLFQRDSKNQVESATKKVATGDFRGAIKLYEAALDGTPKTADIHYRLGLLYDDKLRSPLNALHHMERYLELAPKGTYAKEATAYKKEGELKLLTSLSGGVLIPQREAVDLKNKVLTLSKELADLHSQRATPIPRAASGTTAAKGEVKQKPIPPGARTHVVKPGETLRSIAAQYYHNRARSKDLQDANFYSLEGASNIKPGQVLIIPQK